MGEKAASLNHVIEGIMFQSSLLALHAAIENARQPGSGQIGGAGSKADFSGTADLKELLVRATAQIRPDMELPR